MRILAGHRKPVQALAYSPDGRLLASVGDEGVIFLWDVLSGESVRTLQAAVQTILCLAFSPDGRSLVTGGQPGILHVWDVVSGDSRQDQRLRGHALNAVSFTQD